MSEPRIRVLPDTLVNQIAAGEVVENPASAVKELVENALDAGATRVTVEIDGGGLARLRVVDDGCGMTPEEARLALERHATSKIATVDDLGAIRTLGFRGEALPSIASVGRFRLTTRTRDADVGVRVAAEGGQVRVEPAAGPVGTTVEVTDLFFNVPARLKFQKGERAQVAAVSEVVTRTALAHPDVHFALTSGGRRVWDLPPCRRLADRAAQVFGRDAAGRLHPVSSERDGVRVEGVLGDPGLARPDPSKLVLLVNGRPVTDLGLRRAVVQAFSVLVPDGRFPVAALSVDLDPADVDVNVHPRKVEVRFRNPRDIASAVYAAVAEVVAATPWIAPGSAPVVPAAFDPFAPPPPVDPSGPRLSEWPTVLAGSPREAPPAPPRVQGLFDGPAAPGRARMADLRYVGQVANTILVCEGPGTLVLIDQHAADERVNFDRLWTGLADGAIASERLLFPEVVRLDPADRARLDEAAETLARLGFDLEPYSGDAVAVRAVPAVLRGRAVADAVRECVQAAGDDTTSAGTSRLHKVVATVACHASIRAGDALSESDVRTLLQEMDGIDLAAYCPHGRQAVVVQALPSVLRWFGR